MRVRYTVASRRKRKKILKRARGFVMGRHRLYRTAKEAVIRALAASYKGRKLKKRNFRRLWITRIQAACRLLGFTYSQFISALKKANIALNRKILADIAFRNLEQFKNIAQQAGLQVKEITI
ncbi:MAG: 50S ribosomal protein L20 [Planctomycetota bacterium]